MSSSTQAIHHIHSSKSIPKKSLKAPRFIIQFNTWWIIPTIMYFFTPIPYLLLAFRLSFLIALVAMFRIASWIKQSTLSLWITMIGTQTKHVLITIYNNLLAPIIEHPEGRIKPYLKEQMDENLFINLAILFKGILWNFTVGVVVTSVLFFSFGIVIWCPSLIFYDYSDVDILCMNHTSCFDILPFFVFFSKAGLYRDSSNDWAKLPETVLNYFHIFDKSSKDSSITSKKFKKKTKSGEETVRRDTMVNLQNFVETHQPLICFPEKLPTNGRVGLLSYHQDKYLSTSLKNRTVGAGVLKIRSLFSTSLSSRGLLMQLILLLASPVSIFSVKVAGTVRNHNDVLDEVSKLTAKNLKCETTKYTKHDMMVQ